MGLPVFSGQVTLLSKNNFSFLPPFQMEVNSYETKGANNDFFQELAPLGRANVTHGSTQAFKIIQVYSSVVPILKKESALSAKALNKWTCAKFVQLCQSSE